MVSTTSSSQEIQAEPNSGVLLAMRLKEKSHNYKKLLEAGANVLVAGNTVFGSDNPSETISLLKN